jgi:protein-S-isoprenylcysteine O-methyltransferase Ste14
VVDGCYRHVRNPMYVAVLVVLLGETLVFADARLLAVAAAAWLAAHLFVVRYEELTLARRFGADYAAYRANVPRWLPRLSAWKPGAH